MSLRRRIALILAAVALTVGTVAAFASYLTTERQLRNSVDETLRSRALAVNATPGGAHDGHTADHGDGSPDGSPDGGPDGQACPLPGSFAPASAAQIVTSGGDVVACLDGAPTLPTSASERALSAGEVMLRTADVDGEQYRVLSTRWHDGGTLQLGRSLAETETVLGDLRLRLALIVAAATAVAAALGWAVATRLARPIVRLRDATHRIATTLDFATPVGVSATGEVGSLASSFSAMVGAVRGSQEQQRQLVADASHEMRTPLTSLRSNVELLRHVERLPAGERTEVIDDVLVDVDELAALLSELVELASDLATAEPTEPVCLADLARSTAARTQRRTGRTVDVSDLDPLDTLGRPRQLERAIGNLADNAVKYSDAGAPIVIAIDRTTVTVSDRGRGISPGDVERVFDRFYRAVDVRSLPGSGLGLSIVDEIVRSHGGNVFVRNRSGGGTEIGFTLPASA